MSAALWVLAIAVAMLTGHTAVNAILLRRPSRVTTVDIPVSVLVPARDEAHRIEPCISSLLAQCGVANLEIIVLDDGSTDATADVVRAAAVGDPRLRLVTGAMQPAGWLGKPHACQQLADLATADVLVFVDADVVLAENAIASTVPLTHDFELVSPYPRIVAVGLGGRLVQPLLQWSWLTFLPLRAVERSPRESLTAAGGQFLVVTRSAYEAAGGHAAVRAEVLEDLALARRIKRSGGRVTLADGARIATCRMYDSWRELVAGYSKSLWSAFGGLGPAVAVVAMLLLLYAIPPAAVIAGLAAGQSGWVLAGAVSYGLGVVGRFVAGLRTGARVWPDAFAHPVSVVMFAWLMLRSLRRRRRGLTWKGRRVEVGPPL